MRYLLLPILVFALAGGCVGVGGLRDCTTTVSGSSAGTFQQAARDVAACETENARLAEQQRQYAMAATSQAAQAIAQVTQTAIAVAAMATEQARPTETPTPEPTMTPTPAQTATATPAPTSTLEPMATPTSGAPVNWSGLAALLFGALIVLIGVGLLGRWIARRIDG